MKSQFFYKNREQETFGPFSVEQLREEASAGRLAPEDTVWLKGADNSYEAKSVKGLFVPKETPEVNPESEKSIYLKRDDQYSGPYTLEEVKDFDLFPTDKIGKNTDGPWVEVATQTWFSTNQQTSVPYVDVDAPLTVRGHKKPEVTDGDLKLYDPEKSTRTAVGGPIFAAWLHSQNWRALGEPEKASQTWHWGLGIQLILVLFSLLLFLASGEGAERLVAPVHLVGGVFWYFTFGRQQMKYVENHPAEYYDNKSTLVPSLLFTLIYVSVLLSVYLSIEFLLNK